MHAQSCLTLYDPMDRGVWRVTLVACQTPLSMGFPRQEYWSGLPFPTPGDLPNPGINPASSAPPTLASEFLTAAPPGKLRRFRHHSYLLLGTDMLQ